MNKSTSSPQTHHLMALLCFGLFAGAMALQSMRSPEDNASHAGSIIWNVFQFGVPLLIGGICLTRKRWAFMIAVIYGTVGLALDISTTVQSVTTEVDSTGFIVVILTTGLLNFLLIALGGKAMFSDIKSKDLS